MVHEDPLSLVMGDVIRSSTSDVPVDAVLDCLLGRIVDVLSESAAAMTGVPVVSAPRVIGNPDIRREQPSKPSGP